MIKAVIFDMFETLVTHYRSPLYFSAEMAEDLGLPLEKFREDLAPTDRERSTGLISFEDIIRRIMQNNGISDEGKFNLVLEKRLNAKAEVFDHLHRGILPLLESLKARGIKIACISNCFSEEALAIRESRLAGYFDELFLSYEQGCMKPDREIFLRCLEALSLAPEECLYIGDGGSRELESSSELGMKALHAAWYYPDNHKNYMEIKDFPFLYDPMEVLDYL